MIPTVFDRNDAATLQVGDYRDRLATVTAEGEQKRVKLFVIGFDGTDNVFLPHLRLGQIHLPHLDFLHS